MNGKRQHMGSLLLSLRLWKLSTEEQEQEKDERREGYLTSLGGKLESSAPGKPGAIYLGGSLELSIRRGEKIPDGDLGIRALRLLPISS